MTTTTTTTASSIWKEIKFPDGRSYAGQVVRNERGKLVPSGQGYGIFPKQGCAYEGEWKNGIPDGPGKMSYTIQDANSQNKTIVTITGIFFNIYPVRVPGITIEDNPDRSSSINIDLDVRNIISMKQLTPASNTSNQTSSSMTAVTSNNFLEIDSSMDVMPYEPAVDLMCDSNLSYSPQTQHDLIISANQEYEKDILGDSPINESIEADKPSPKRKAENEPKNPSPKRLREEIEIIDEPSIKLNSVKKEPECIDLTEDEEELKPVKKEPSFDVNVDLSNSLNNYYDKLKILQFTTVNDLSFARWQTRIWHLPIRIACTRKFLNMQPEDLSKLCELLKITWPYDSIRSKYDSCNENTAKAYQTQTDKNFAEKLAIELEKLND